MRKSIILYLVLLPIFMISFLLSSCSTLPPVLTTIAEPTSTSFTEATTAPETVIVTEDKTESADFSFDEYMDKVKVREYNLVKEQDISVSNNYRMKYCVIIPRDITEEELRSTLVSIIKDKSISNPEIDEIYIAAWYDEAAVEKAICLAFAEWCPDGEWGSAAGDIAESNNRQSYLINFNLNTEIKEEQIKYGLTEQERKQVFYDLVALQDKISFDDPDYDKKMDQAEETVAAQYGLTVEEVKGVGIEGTINGWPMPDLN
jgi:hypothetical protein